MVERPLVRFYRTRKTDEVLSIPDGFSLEPRLRTSSESSRTFVSSTPFIETPSHHPQDGGRAAWIFLFGACIVEAVSWGFPACFGVFREYYFTHPPFIGNTTIAVTGVLSDGCLQMLMPFLLLFLRYFPRFNKRMMWIGLVFCVVGCAGASMSSQAWQVIATQGALYGIGAGLLSAPVIIFMTEWFDKRQSFAYGVMFGASGWFGSFMPTVYAKLLHSFGQRVALLSHGAGVLVLIIAALMCIDHRVAPCDEDGGSETSRKTVYSSKMCSFWKTVSFWLLGSSVLCQALVLNLPAIYLPSYVTDLSCTPTQGAAALSMYNLTTTTGSIGFGLYTDHRDSFCSTALLSTIIISLASMLLWAEAKTLFASIVFVIIYGAFSGGFGILRSRFAATVVGDVDDKQQILMVLSLFTATRGAGNVVGGFIGQGLVKEHIRVELMTYGLTKWTPLMIFVGIGMFCAGICIGLMYLILRMDHKRAYYSTYTKRLWPRGSFLTGTSAR